MSRALDTDHPGSWHYSIPRSLTHGAVRVRRHDGRTVLGMPTLDGCPHHFPEGPCILFDVHEGEHR